MDIVDHNTRSRMMSSIRGKNTRPEILLRKLLHAQGYRFRLHRKDLPGKPDVVLPRFRLAIFVHGCFWHRHKGCFYATSPASRSDFWNAKLNGNVERDRRQCNELEQLGWRVLVVWECGLKQKVIPFEEINEMIVSGAMFQEWPRNPVRVRESQ